jgi:hypothetical protein
MVVSFLTKEEHLAPVSKLFAKENWRLSRGFLTAFSKILF